MLIPITLSDGAGTRLWPLSRELYPKQLLSQVGAVHRIETSCAEPLEVIEVPCGSCFGEDDIVRLDDLYGHKGRTDRC